MNRTKLFIPLNSLWALNIIRQTTTRQCLSWQIRGVAISQSRSVVSSQLGSVHCSQAGRQAGRQDHSASLPCPSLCKVRLATCAREPGQCRLRRTGSRFPHEICYDSSARGWQWQLCRGSDGAWWPGRVWEALGRRPRRFRPNIFGGPDRARSAAVTHGRSGSCLCVHLMTDLNASWR
jgi:hypothetical protein